MLVVLAVVATGGMAVAWVLRSDRQSAGGLGAAGTSHPPTLQPISVDDTSGPTFARSILPAVQQAFPGAAVSVVSGDAEPLDWGGPVYGARYSIVQGGVTTSLYVEVGAAEAAYAGGARDDGCALVPAGDTCLHLGGGELWKTRAHGSLPAQVASVQGPVVVRWTSLRGSAGLVSGEVPVVALDRAVLSGLPHTVVSAPAGPVGTDLVELQTWVRARALLAPFGATTWRRTFPKYDGSDRTPATVTFHPPGGGTLSVVVADPRAHQWLPRPPSGAVVARISSNGLRFEDWATQGVLDQQQVEELVRVVAASS